MNKMIKDLNEVNDRHSFKPFGNGERTVDKIIHELEKENPVHIDPDTLYFNNSIPHINLLVAHAIRKYKRDAKATLILGVHRNLSLKKIEEHLTNAGILFKTFDDGKNNDPRFKIYFEGVDDANIKSLTNFNQISDLYRILEESDSFSYGFNIGHIDIELAHIYEYFDNFETIKFSGDLRERIKLESSIIKEAESYNPEIKTEEDDEDEIAITREPVEPQKMSKGAKIVLAALVISGFIMAIANS